MILYIQCIGPHSIQRESSSFAKREEGLEESERSKAPVEGFEGIKRGRETEEGGRQWWRW